MQKPLALWTLALHISLGAVYAAPPCSGSRPVAVCAQFVNPYSYNGNQWATACGVNTGPSTLIAYNGVTNLNASLPSWYVHLVTILAAPDALYR